MPKQSLFAVWACAWVVACAGERSSNTRSLGSSNRPDAAVVEDAEEPASPEEAPQEGSETPEDVELDATVPDDGGLAPETGADPDGVEGQGGDAQTAVDITDGSAGATTPAPSYSSLFRPSLSLAALPEAVVSLAQTPISDEERMQPDAVEYQVVTGLLDPDAPRSDPQPGLNSWVLVRWGFIANAPVPAGGPAWRDFSGYVAVAQGSIELQRAVRWDGPAEPATPRPLRDVVPVQTDPRVLRFASQLGSGSDGLLLRFHRPSIEPTVVVIALGTATRYYPFEHFLATRAQSGGWSMAIGQGLVHSEQPGGTTSCYASNASLSGTLSYRAMPSTAPMALSATLTRDDGSEELLTLSADAEPVGPYGGLSGTLASSGAQVQGYFGRDWIFADYDNAGVVLLQIVAPGATDPELVYANYDGTRIRSGRAFRSLDCGALGAIASSPFAP